ncbi:hypothetical protein ASG25_09330 [Rhizobium sp. Leaf384]|uniref:transposase n=1 Tax=Rhizobium sp. Leaf384 TaxID=1736358 RepID=UPI000712B15F|nr:transposase [Rhizobium sp. Leaf384]KQS78827.1 hypothetical protein ASG25_09330 [Rhizobium sp. Leaf384]
MVGDDEQQAPSGTGKASEASEHGETQQSDRVEKKPRKSRSEKGRTEVRAKRQVKRHTADERADKLRRVQDSVTKDGLSLKAAVEAVGISDQTYYQWKRASKPASPGIAELVPARSLPTPVAAANPGNKLVDLLKLEEENQRLRELLGEKLRAENAELRRRLEMD